MLRRHISSEESEAQQTHASRRFAVRSEIDPSLLHLIEELPAHAAVKFFTDAPLELLPVGGLPMGLRYVCSRVPVTPGNLFASIGLGSRPLLLEPESLSRILVINALQDEDPLKNMFRTAITEITKVSSETLDMRRVDVNGVASFRDALNSLDGSILLFDGHGGYSRSLGEGSLHLGAETTDVISSIGNVRVPPIVILSACETHPMDGTYATVANAFLALGAQAVLASLVPLEGRHAALLVGRLMLRLAAYLPEIEKTPIAPVRWSEFITGMLRMSYVTDVLTGLRKQGGPNFLRSAVEKFKARRTTSLIIYIPTGSPRHCKLWQNITKRSLNEVKQTHFNEAFFADSLHYVHFGNPEEITIMRSSTSKPSL